MRTVQVVFAYLLIVAISAVVTVACINVQYPIHAFRCDPLGEPPKCPDDYICCSDDPTAMTVLEGEKMVTPLDSVPGYGDHARDGEEGKDGYAIPLFSGKLNNNSRSGMCVAVGSFSGSRALDEKNAKGCPIPCNPTWKQDNVEKVCGSSGLCCQTVEMYDNDCVFDPTMGSSGCFRPVTGADLLQSPSEGEQRLTSWGWNDHSTNQDPGGAVCGKLFNSKGDDEEKYRWTECLRRLTVANQRGFCRKVGDGGEATCPLGQSHENTCDRKNAENGNAGCGS